MKVCCDEHFDYYISVLSKTHKFKNIYNIIELYEEAESMYDDFNKWSHDKSNEIIDFLKSSSVYNKMNELSLPSVSYNKKPFKGELNKKHLSVDLVQANWQVFKYYDDNNELPNTYDSLLDSFGLPEVLKYFENYRQFIFGNLNTNRQQTIQVSLMQGLIKIMKYDANLEFTIADLKHDELILTDYNQDVIDFLSTTKIKFRVEEFVPIMVDNVRVKEYYEPGTNNLIYKDLFMSDGNKFYFNLKKYILDEPIELRDLYFRENGELAIWVEDRKLLKEML